MPMHLRRLLGAFAVLACACGGSGGGGFGVCANSPLSVATGPAQSAAKRATIQLDGSASGGQGSVAYLWHLEAAPAGSKASLSSATSQRPTFVADQAGIYVASLLVKDACGSATASTVVTVENRPPVASAGPDRNALPGDQVTLDGTASADPDLDDIVYRWSLVSRPVGSSAALSSASAAAPTFVPDRFGTYVAVLTVSDGQDSSAPAAVVVQVGVTGAGGNCAPAAPPVAVVGPDQTIFSGVQLDGSRSTTGRAGALTYKWTIASAPAGSSPTLSNSAGAQPSFFVDRPGVYVVTLVVNDGCVDSAPASVKVTRLNNPPSASVFVSNSPVPILVPVAFNVFASDFDNDPLTYQWQVVTAPAGSTAAFTNPKQQNAGFAPDLPGNYTVSLVVSDGTASSTPAIASFAAANLPPVAVVGPDQAASPGATVTLDGSASQDPSRRTLGFAWTLQGPAGSAATLIGAATAKPSFVPDVPGAYRALLTVSAGGLSAQASTTVAVWPPVVRLAHRVVDADYSAALDRLVMVAADPNALYLYDPRTKTETTIALPLPPASVSLGADGLFAVVAHDSAASYVDLAGAAVVRTLAFTGDLALAVLGDNAFVYAFPRAPVTDHIRMLAQPLAGGPETTVTSVSLTGAPHPKVRSGAGALYLTSGAQFSFTTIEKYSLAGGTPALVPLVGIPFFAPECGNLWLSEAATRIFNRCGVVLRASSAAADDLTSAGALQHAGPEILLRHLSDSTAAGEVSAVASADAQFFNPPDDQTLRRWNANGLTLMETAPFPDEQVGAFLFRWHGRFVFYRSDGSERYVVLQLDPGAGVVQDFGVVTF
ncbi:MAG TPA: PKD domain-containing protein [Myxococcales bacterium]